MTNLLERKCQAFGATAMSEIILRSHLVQVSGWTLTNGALEKTFSFKDDLEAIVFVNALAWTCHVENHHPDLALSYDRCVVRFTTHSIHAVSINDFICAAKADALVAFAG